MLHTPILFLIFNRPDTTARVFEKIREIKPARLYLAADGPREHKDGEAEKCKAARELVMNNIDWPCEIKTLFREQNLGCKLSVSGSINWFFENEEQGIILEDDCLPDLSFFDFCEQLLAKYKDVVQVMQISGDNFQNGIKRGKGDYYFSRLNHIWGWATWRRAWKFYDLEMKGWEDFKKSGGMESMFESKEVREYYTKEMDAFVTNNVDTWDLQWTVTMWINSGLCILPNLNLISNIGFGEEATHTKSKVSKLSNIPVNKISETLIHPAIIEADIEADKSYYAQYIYVSGFDIFKYKVKRFIQRIVF